MHLYLTVMLFILVAASLTILLLGIVFWPAIRRKTADVAPEEHAFDLTIYKDQLRELDADLERGAIEPAEADYARAEIGRRLLAAQEAADAEAAESGKDRMTGGPVLAAAAVFAPLAAALIYSMTGSPGMDAQPLAARVDEIRQQQAAQTLQGMDVEELVSRAEAHLAQNPNDGRGWDVLAPMYLRLGRPQEARQAFERAIALQGEDAKRRSGLGQAYYMLAGTVDVNARAEFQRALELDAGDSRSRFFLALAAAEAGNVDGAVQGWQAMLEPGAAAPEWQAAAAEGVRRYGEASMAAAPQLDEETVRDVQGMNAEDRNAMILGMISQLDERLRDNPDDIAGWQRLIRSYVVLGRRADAEEALSRASEAFASDAEKRDTIVNFAAALGISSGGSVQ
ncbi:c-type cytochrome biogenesis protein CcmI [Oricola sp.]|uniref:c-type cytochrome biogenesis protein CcmI n=1 Tax=Oricola sp. TaxID=1979950 RepID=UPI0035137186